MHKRYDALLQDASNLIRPQLQVKLCIQKQNMAV